MTEASAGRGPIVIWNPAAGRKVGIPTNVDLDEAGVRALFAGGGPRDRAVPHHVRGGGRGRRSRGSVAAGDGQPIVAAGGDGTFRTVACALLDLGGEDPEAMPPLGILPLGSVMNVARSLAIPRDLEGAVRVIADGHVRTIDVGEVVGWGPFLEARRGRAPRGAVRGGCRARRRRRPGAVPRDPDRARATGRRA